jgi:hypothetical protein
MLNYKDWETLNESIGTGYTLGLTNPASLGLVGDNFQEAKPPFVDDEDDDDDEDGDEDYDGEITDDEEDDGLEGDIMGGDEEDGIMGSGEGPESSFPPDGDMDDAEDDDEMAGVLGDIDPELAGLGDDELGPELTGGDMGDLEGGDMDMGDLEGGDMDMGDELGDEMGDMDMGGEMGDMEMGDMEMGDELGDEMGGEMMPCPDCCPDGDIENCDPECETCGGMGEVEDEMGGEMGDLDVDMEDDMGGMDMGDEDVEGDAIAMTDLMHRMQDYMSRYMAPKMAAHMGDHMDSGAKYMSKMAPDTNLAAKHKADSGSGQVRRPKHPIKVKARSFMHKDEGKKHMCSGKCETFVGAADETHEDFLSNLAKGATSGLPQKGRSGLSEDALFQVVSPEEMSAPEPQAGGVGFAPQGRVGAIGGGYTQDDISDIPVLGEAKKRYITLDEYIAKKAS